MAKKENALNGEGRHAMAATLGDTVRIPSAHGLRATGLERPELHFGSNRLLEARRLTYRNGGKSIYTPTRNGFRGRAHYEGKQRIRREAPLSTGKKHSRKKQGRLYPHISGKKRKRA